MSFRLCATEIETSPHRGKRKFSFHGRKIDTVACMVSYNKYAKMAAVFKCYKVSLPFWYHGSRET